jgi:putative membrane protein
VTDLDAESTAPVAVSRGARGLLRHTVVGFMMGAADVVPGVSGGTVAFVLGVYERLIDALRDGSRAVTDIVRGRLRVGFAQLRQVDWPLLLPLLAGILIAVASLASVLERALEDEPVKLAGLFVGLVAGSAIIAIGRFHERIDLRLAAIVAGVSVLTFLALGIVTETDPQAGTTANAPLWAYPIAGAIAICAMILPGISGSFLLVVLGMYGDVLAAVNDRDLGIILLFVLGCAVGLLSFSRALAWLLHHFHDVVLAVLIGLMVGSVRVLWPWPGGTATTEIAAPSGDVFAPIVLAVVGCAVVVTLGLIGALREEPTPVPD